MAPLWRAITSYLLTSQATLGSPTPGGLYEKQPGGRSERDVTLSGRSNHGAVASESDLCSKIGIDILNRHGNAADALVGTVFCVGVVGVGSSLFDQMADRLENPRNGD